MNNYLENLKSLIKNDPIHWIKPEVIKNAIDSIIVTDKEISFNIILTNVEKNLSLRKPVHDYFLNLTTDFFNKIDEHYLKITKPNDLQASMYEHDRRLFIQEIMSVINKALGGDPLYLPFIHSSLDNIDSNEIHKFGSKFVMLNIYFSLEDKNRPVMIISSLSYTACDPKTDPDNENPHVYKLNTMIETYINHDHEIVQ